MPKGFHYGRIQLRQYTTQFNKLFASELKSLLSLPLGSYRLVDNASSTPIELKEKGNGNRFISFKNSTLKIQLITCKRSVSTKLYLTCPYCQTRRQHLYRNRDSYACKTCLRLYYASQSEREQDRLARKIRKLRKGIWGSLDGINNLTESVQYFAKPKSKHWVKFEYEKAVLLELERKYWMLADVQINKLLSI
ncbi:hypothetical protein ATW7_05521 [Alteromonadales bacterium TW-7]|nr:hypothetical protein ATW7_05521 [Alteromonadales bacterium TW-7]